MSKPTRGQWRGYIVLSIILAIVLLLLVFLPTAHREPPQADFSALDEAIMLYGDEIEAQQDSAWRAWREEHYGNGGRRYDNQAAYLHRHDGWQYGSRHAGYDDDNRRYSRRDSSYHDHRGDNSYGNLVVDINHADTAQLCRLRGIGATYSRRIVKYRNLLGGFANKEQLREVYGVSEELYESIADHVVVDTAAIHRLDINHATINELRRHPYLDYYQAKAIVDYREAGHAFNSVDDLMLIPLVDEATAIKILPYVQFK